MIDSSTPNVMDPSAPGVTKQVMLDWMRINHPKSPIATHLNKSDVAVKVREKQPDFFPDPKSNNPALVPTVSDIADPLQIDAAVPTILSKAHAKRSASPTSSTKNPKRTHLGDEGINLPNKIPSSWKPKEKKKKRITKKFPFFDSSEPLHSGSDTTKPAIQDSALDFMERDSRKDLKALKHFEAVPMDESTKPLGRVFSSQKSEKFNTILPKAAELRDLINFSEVDLLAVDDLDIGGKAPSHSSSTTIYKSGIDIFKEERLQVERLRVLEESVSNMLSRIESLEKQSGTNIGKHEKERYELDHSLELATNRLDKQEEYINVVKDTVSSLKKELNSLINQCNRVDQEIRTHEKCIIRLMEQHEESEVASTSDDN